MLISKSQTKKDTKSDQCTVWGYDFPSKLLSFATAYINGRYPDIDRVSNLDCEGIYYVTGGSGVVHSEFGDFKIIAGDVYHFKKAEKYWVEGKDLKLVLVNAPKWTINQYKKVR
ncbi:MAG TPA: hypothetical protein PKG71_04610 [Candidatus Woesebacteria bacterium]|nr:hypothetical protein [Candidatus Woesebacteria bacterium]HNS95219.1 hypothetical protein [Candidatus Woesebacteria bacterium]